VKDASAALGKRLVLRARSLSPQSAHKEWVYVMTGKGITDLFERLSRLVAASQQNAGDGSAWDYTFPDGETHRYIIRGLKSHAEAEDSACNLIIWVWNTKDYLKQRAKVIGMESQLIEQAVDINHDLLICADLANRLKHGGLNRSRSGQDPLLGKISFDAPQTAIGAMIFRRLEVEVHIADPSQVEFHLPVLNKKGDVIGDVFEYAARGIAALEKIRDGVERRSPH